MGASDGGGRSVKRGRPSPDLTGQRYGKLLVVERAPTASARAAAWSCRCRCGQVKVVLAQELKSGHTRSCGCGRAADLKGRAFGRLTVLERAPQGERGRGVWWRCRCSCGQVRSIRADNLTTGTVRSCGCLRAEKGTEKAAAMRAALSKAGTRTKRVGDAFAAVFRPPPDTVHVDRPGARVVRGTRY